MQRNQTMKWHRESRCFMKNLPSVKFRCAVRYLGIQSAQLWSNYSLSLLLVSYLWIYFTNVCAHVVVKHLHSGLVCWTMRFKNTQLSFLHTDCIVSQVLRGVFPNSVEFVLIVRTTFSLVTKLLILLSDLNRCSCRCAVTVEDRKIMCETWWRWCF